MKKEISEKNNNGSSAASDKSNEAKAPSSTGNIDLLDVGDSQVTPAVVLAPQM